MTRASNGADDRPGGGPEALRRALAAYVAALHEAYLDTARGRAPDRLERLPLAGEPFAVAIVAAPELHVLGTRDPLPDRRDHEQPLWGELDPLRWEVRFLDPTVVPELGEPPGEDADLRERVLAALGIRRTLYHLMLGTEASLGPHHAMHAGTGLANAHLGSGS